MLRHINLNRFLQLSPNLVSLTIIILCVVFLGRIQQSKINEITGETAKAEHKQEEHRQRLALSLIQKLPQNSYRNLLADWLFLSFLQYFGDSSARQVTRYSLNQEFFAAIVRHDPKFVGAYLYLSPATSLYGGRPDKTVAIMNQGLQSLSPEIQDSYWIWIYKGTDELLFLDNIIDAKTSYLQGGKWAQMQKIQDDDSRRTIESAQRMASFMDKNSVSPNVRINAWLMLLGNARGDVNLQNYILSKIKDLGAKILISPDGRLEIKMPKEN
jgi:hypothetical protein